MAGCERGVLLVLGRTDYEVSLDAALEVWGDIARDADFIGLTVTRAPSLERPSRNGVGDSAGSAIRESGHTQ
jgi:hypothetical protein